MEKTQNSECLPGPGILNLHSARVHQLLASHGVRLPSKIPSGKAGLSQEKTLFQICLLETTYSFEDNNQHFKLGPERDQVVQSYMRLKNKSG